LGKGNLQNVIAQKVVKRFLIETKKYQTSPWDAEERQSIDCENGKQAL
jgi:hypothetical protein